MNYDQQADALNATLREANNSLFTLLSERGKAAFFPKSGILNQTAQAKGCAINATIGIALEDDASVMCSSALSSQIPGIPKLVFNYAPGTGLPGLRETWKKQLVEKNPSLAATSFSTPLVTTALTHGLLISGLLFVNQADTVIVPAPFWENYSLIFEETCGGILDTFPQFIDREQFNVQGLEAKLRQHPGKKKIILLNYPNNPTGYTPTYEQADAIIDLLRRSAEAGDQIVAIIDDAYFGLFYEPGTCTESLFCRLSTLHESIIAVKIDGPTKEDYAWGMRVGFITFGTKNGSAALYGAIEQKCAGIIRSTISNAPHISQWLLQNGYVSGDHKTQQKEKFQVLRNRYEAVRKILADHPEYRDVFAPFPFNSGYFMCIETVAGIDAEKLRLTLINRFSTGLVVFGNLIRIAFSSVPTHDLERLFANIYLAGQEQIGRFNPRPPLTGCGG